MLNEVPILNNSDLRAVLKKFGITGDHLDKDAKPLVRLRMCQALLDAAEAQVLQAEGDALAEGIGPDKVQAAHAVAFAGASATDGAAPLMFLQARAMSLFAAINQLEPDPRAIVSDPVLAAAAAAGLAGLLHFRYEAAAGGNEAEAEKRLAEAGRLLQQAADQISDVFEMAARLRRPGSPNRPSGASGTARPAPLSRPGPAHLRWAGLYASCNASLSEGIFASGIAGLLCLPLDARSYRTNCASSAKSLSSEHDRTAARARDGACSRAHAQGRARRALSR
ncbi:hypothetical protein FHR32_004312 [Streptosporangium album]|uniref:Uncharacterized protein n=1 Tax=Streptosporangium album TaxID=47479 RepID=A0A7W7RXS8_9ACTN|nr:hypothetical protein [Streptosporangium album]MBB4940007.1 hypothetical protein [Streptosporangium album]